MTRGPQTERGGVLVVVLIAIMLMAGLSGVMLMGALGGQRATSKTVQATALLFVAEAGLDYNFVQMSEDPLYAVKDLTFQLQVSDEIYSSPSLTLDAGASQQSFEYQLQYLLAGTPVAFADRLDPIEPWDEIKVTCTATGPRSTRVIASWYAIEVVAAYRGAITSDMLPTGTSGFGEPLAKLGHVTFDDDYSDGDHAIFGDVVCNGGFYADFTGLSAGNINSYVDAHNGQILKDLNGTEDELPDYTDPGGSDQLFDFARFKAAAVAGAGQIYTSTSDFITAMNNANSAGDKLEGITVLEIDSVAEGAFPQIDTGDIPGGIHITGTFMITFSAGTSSSYELNIQTPLNINAADLSSWDMLDEGTYTTGYPGTYVDVNKKPSAVDISPAHENFVVGDDYPALMLNNAELDLAADSNVCGVVYSPSYIELDNNGDASQVQYFNGGIYVGKGLCFEGDDEGVKAVRYDSNTIDQLQVKDGKGEVLVRTGYAILK